MSKARTHRVTLTAQFNRVAPLPVRIRWWSKVVPRGVVVRYARRSDRFSLEVIGWLHPNRVTLRRALGANLGIDRRQARTLARRLGRLARCLEVRP